MSKSFSKKVRVSRLVKIQAAANGLVVFARHNDGRTRPHALSGKAELQHAKSHKIPTRFHTARPHSQRLMNMSDYKFRAWKEELIARARAHAATTTSNEDAALTKETLDDPQKALAYAFTRHWPGYPLGDRSKVQVSICLSADVLDYYLSGGPG
jgi:uncharacterized protein (DUF4415 family)